MSIKVKTFSINQLLHSVLRWGSIILVVIAIVLLSLLSFVDKLGLNPNVRNLTTIALIGVILNYSIWDTFYKDQYTKVMSDDINQIAVKRYSIHKRYYDARKGLTQDILREYIHQYNKLLRQRGYKTLKILPVERLKISVSVVIKVTRIKYLFGVLNTGLIQSPVLTHPDNY